jgi:flagellar biosynthetic protein FliR
MIVRLTVAVMIGAAIFSSGLVTVAVYTPTVPGFVMAVLMEFMAGAVMGFVLFFVFNIILMVGHILDFMMGLAMVNMVDPLLQIQVPIVGNLFFMSMMALLAVTGGLANFVESFIASYTVLPIGAAWILGNQSLAAYFVWLMASFVLIAFSIALPIVGALTVINIALGIMVKAAPQMNVFVIGIPIRIFVGFFLLMTTMVGPMYSIYRRVFDEALYGLSQLIWGMVPVYV